MKKIETNEILRVLYEHLWIMSDKAREPLRFADFRDVMLETETIVSTPTIKNKWKVLNHIPCVRKLTDELYSVNIPFLAEILGYATPIEDDGPLEGEDEIITWGADE